MLVQAQLTTAAGSGDPEQVAPFRAKRMRVLHFLNWLGRAGTELTVLNLISGLGNGLFEHGVCTMHGYESELLERRFPDGQIFVAGRHGRHFELMLFRLARIIQRFRPDIVHSRNWFSIEGLLAARMVGVPITVHSEHGYDMHMLDGLPLRRRWLRRRAFGLANAVFTVTRELREFHARQTRFPVERIRVIYNGVDTRRFLPCPVEGQHWRAQFGLAADGFLVGTVGRMTPIKDQLTLLQAVEILLRRGIQARLVLAGDGLERAALEAYASSSDVLRGRVLFLGEDDGIPALLNAVDVFALPSLREGMSNTLLEAMACGRAVLATRAGGNPEVVDDGHTGLLFTPGDREGLAHILQMLAEEPNLRSQLGAAARERVLQRFRLERMLEDYRNLYLELATRHGLLVSNRTI